MRPKIWALLKAYLGGLVADLFGNAGLLLVKIAAFIAERSTGSALELLATMSAPEEAGTADQDLLAQLLVEGVRYQHPEYPFDILLPQNRLYDESELHELASLVARLSNTEQFDHVYQWLIAVSSLYRMMVQLPHEDTVTILIDSNVATIFNVESNDPEVAMELKVAGIEVEEFRPLNANPTSAVLTGSSPRECQQFYNSMPKTIKTSFKMGWVGVGVDHSIFLPEGL